jgi:hypothetical protein
MALQIIEGDRRIENRNKTTRTPYGGEGTELFKSDGSDTVTTSETLTTKVI